MKTFKCSCFGQPPTESNWSLLQSNPAHFKTQMPECTGGREQCLRAATATGYWEPAHIQHGVFYRHGEKRIAKAGFGKKERVHFKCHVSQLHKIPQHQCLALPALGWSFGSTEQAEAAALHEEHLAHKRPTVRKCKSRQALSRENLRISTFKLIFYYVAFLEM